MKIGPELSYNITILFWKGFKKQWIEFITGCH